MPSPCADPRSRFLRIKAEKSAFDDVRSSYEKRGKSITRDELKRRREAVTEAIRFTREFLRPSLEAFAEVLNKESAYNTIPK